MFVRVRHAINLRASLLEKFGHLFGSGISLGHINTLLDSATLFNVFLPFFQSGPFSQIDLQSNWTASDP